MVAVMDDKRRQHITNCHYNYSDYVAAGNIDVEVANVGDVAVIQRNDDTFDIYDQLHQLLTYISTSKFHSCSNSCISFEIWEEILK